MHVSQSTGNLMDILPDPLLWKAYVFFDCFLNDELEVTFLCPFDRDEELVKFIVDEPV